METIDKSKLFKLAHAIQERGSVESFAKALTQAWKVLRLEMRLLTEKVAFTYRKVNGDFRNAYGTLAIPNFTASAIGSGKCADQIAYWDEFAHGWRSFIAGNLVSVNS